MELKYNRIIFVTVSMTGGGTERVIATLSNYLVSQGYEVTILQIAEATMAYELDARVEVIRVGETSGGSIKKRLERIRNMRRIFKEKKPANIMALGTVCSIFSGIANLGIKKNHLVVSERNKPDRMNMKPYTKGGLMLRNFAYRRANTLVLQTEDSKAYFPSDIVKKSVIIGNPLTSKLPDVYEGVREKKIIGAARLIEEKNHPLLIDAFSIFSKTHPEYTLEIYGKGELEQELKDQIKRLGIEDKAQIMQFASDLHDRIRKASIFVSASNGEGLSNSIMEALALGIPVIGTDCPVGGTKMLINDGRNGLLVPMNTVETMVEAMCKIADDEELASAMSLEGRKIREVYSEEMICKQWMEIMR